MVEKIPGESPMDYAKRVRLEALPPCSCSELAAPLLSSCCP